MKKVIPLFLVSMVSFSLLAQQKHYIYIQTDDKRSFYVKLNDKLYSSASSGYVIVPKLVDGTYDLYMGFPKNEWPQHHFVVKIDKVDQGYIFKDLGDKGWGLFNMRSLKTIMGGSNNTGGNVGKPVSNDEFSTTLSNVVNDPNILVKQPIKEEQRSVARAEDRPSISKISSVSKEEGTEIVYVNKWDGKIDTVKILIPVEKARSTQLVQVPERSKTETVMDAESKPSKPIMINSDCKKNATDDDFIQLRKKMIAEDNDDDMVTVARKVFKTRCFTTAQVKNLAVLFLNDEGKYKLFDAAYPFVSDTGNFSSLRSMLTEQYQINRFQALTSKN